jgi:ubiquitin carboxyl-terminal hydrolase 5/13
MFVIFCSQATAYIGAEVSSAAGGSEVLMGESEAPVLPVVPFSACLARFSGEEELEDYYSAAAGGKVAANRRSRIATFPPYLVVQLKR